MSHSWTDEVVGPFLATATLPHIFHTNPSHGHHDNRLLSFEALQQHAGVSAAIRDLRLMGKGARGALQISHRILSTVASLAEMNLRQRSTSHALIHWDIYDE